MTDKEALHKQVVKNVKKVNAMLQQLRGQIDKKNPGWAATRMLNYLSVDIINAVTDKGYIKFNKNLSVGQMNAILKATNNFLKAKTSTVQGVIAAKNKIIAEYQITQDISYAQAESLYAFFESEDYKISDEVKYEVQKIAIEMDKKNADEMFYLERVKQYIDYGNDENMKKQLIDIFNIFNKK